MSIFLIELSRFADAMSFAEIISLAEGLALWAEGLALLKNEPFGLNLYERSESLFTKSFFMRLRITLHE